MSSPTPYPLGRRVNHDPRSRQFPFSARPEASLEIKTVLWARQVPIFDQGDLGSCTGNAAAGWLGTDCSLRSGLMSVPGTDGLDERVTEQLALAIYSAATEIDPFDGSYPPDDTGSDGTSVSKVLKARGLVESYSHCFSFDDLLAALQSGPVLFGSNWYQGMFEPDRAGVVTISGEVAGGHEFLAIGVDVDAEQIHFANSWGPGWALSGFFKMSYETVKQLLSEDGDATVLHALVKVPEPPAPAPDPVVPSPEPVSPPPFSWSLMLRALARWLRALVGGR